MANTAEMTFGLSFGSFSGPARDEARPTRFRIAILGDFSGRAARGEVEIGSDLAARRPIKLDVDTLDKVIKGFSTDLILPIGRDGAGIEVSLSSIDDLHPDELFSNVAMFEELMALKRRLSSGKTAASAVKDLKAWGEAFGQRVSPPARKSAGNAVPSDRRLTDFAKLVGGTAARKAEASSTDDLLQRIVGPYVQAMPDPDASDLQEATEDALAGAMRLVLHHPEFQSVEAQWRTLDLITRNVETDQKLDLVLYDISAEELAADLAAEDDLSQTGFATLLSESTPDGRGPFSAVCALYTFEETPPHAELLGRIAQVAAHVRAAFFAAITPTFLETKTEDRHPLVAQAWDALRALPEAGYLGLVSPRFLLRRPYGAKSDPISEFDFEEFTEAEGLSGMLWANPVALVVILLARSFRKSGPSLGLGQIMSLGGMPFHYVKDRHGDQVALPCTERNLTQTKTQATIGRGYMPVISVKGRDEVRLGSFQALSGETVLGFWSDVPPPKPRAETPRRTAAPLAAAEEDAFSAPTEALADAAAETAAGVSSVDDDLDALLASFGDDFGSSDGAADASAVESSGDVDADLAALLASL